MDAQKETRIMYILDERGELREIEREKAVQVEKPIKVRLKNAFEVFVRVDGTENYWISNYGRCMSNYNQKEDEKFHIHKAGNVHYTIYGTDRDKIETKPSYLVAKMFLKQYEDRLVLWHKDGDKSNNWYKNLIWVNEKDFWKLKTCKATLEELGLVQEYVEYQNKASHEAYKVYNAVKLRCGNSKEKDYISKCYDEVTMCQEWLENPKSFVKWYLEHYYEVDGELTVIDKDLFGKGKMIYSPETCCIIPQSINTFLTNCKKHYREGKCCDNTLPLGVYYNKTLNKYYAKIQFAGLDKPVDFTKFDTPEEAFEEYRYLKKLDVYRMAASYKDKIPEYIYDELLKIEIEPY